MEYQSGFSEEIINQLYQGLTSLEELRDGENGSKHHSHSRGHHCQESPKLK